MFDVELSTQGFAVGVVEVSANDNKMFLGQFGGVYSCRDVVDNLPNLAVTVYIRVILNGVLGWYVDGGDNT